MAFINTKTYAKDQAALEKRLAAIEEAIGTNEVHTVDQELTLLDVFDPDTAALLMGSDFQFKIPAQVAAVSDEELRSVPGIGPATLKKIRAALEGA